MGEEEDGRRCGSKAREGEKKRKKDMRYLCGRKGEDSLGRSLLKIYE